MFPLKHIYSRHKTDDSHIFTVGPNSEESVHQEQTKEEVKNVKESQIKGHQRSPAGAPYRPSDIPRGNQCRLIDGAVLTLGSSCSRACRCRRLHSEERTQFMSERKRSRLIIITHPSLHGREEESHQRLNLIFSRRKFGQR